MTLNDTMQHYTTLYTRLYNTIIIRLVYGTIPTPYNVIQDYTTIYKAIRHCTNNSNK
jgi:hypothetical protein